MIRVAIVDDDPTIQILLKKHLQTYEKKTGERFRLTLFDDASQVAVNYISSYDIIFMDVEMKDMDGMTGAELIRQQDREVIIIFVTNMAGYAIKGYKVDAMSYVLKPILYIDFAQQVQKAIKRIEFKKSGYILINSNSEIHRLDVSKICYLETKEHKVLIQMETEVLTINSSIRKLEQQLEGYCFERCNSGYLVSLSHVEGIERDMVRIGEYLLPISRPKKKSFMNALSDFIGGVYK